MGRKSEIISLAVLSTCSILMLSFSWTSHHKPSAHPSIKAICNSRESVTCEFRQNFVDRNEVIHVRDYVSGTGSFHIRPHHGINHISAFVRLNGPVVDTIHFVQDYDHNTWTAHYTACEDGVYTAAIYTVLQDESEDAVFQGVSCMGPQFEHPVLFEWVENRGRLQCTTIWYWEGNLSREFPTRNHGVISRYVSNLASDYEKQFEDLKFKLPEVAVSRLFPKNAMVCLFGDSHIRQMYNIIISMLDPANCSPIELQNTHSTCAWKGFHYYRNIFGLDSPTQSDWTYDAILPSCSQIFINFGHWPLAQKCTSAWNFEVFRIRLRNFLEKFLNLTSRHPHIHVTWVASNPRAIAKFLRTCPPLDCRFPHVIAKYNQIAHEECLATQKIEYLDTRSVMFPLFDLAFDGIHYLGPVGKAGALSLANHIMRTHELQRKQNESG